MSIRLFLSVVVAIFLAGCATSPVSSIDAAPVPADRVFAHQDRASDADGVVMVTRDKGFFGGGCHVAVTIDGALAAHMAIGETARFYLPSGQHLVGLTMDKTGAGICSWGSTLKEQAASVAPGETVRFRIQGDMNTGLDIRPTSI